MQALDREVKKLHKNNICLKIIGDVSRFSETLQEKNQKSGKFNRKKIPHLHSILRQITAVVGILFKPLNKLQKKVKKEEMSVSDINNSTFQHHLATQNAPPVDLLIRTSGEQRISNFFIMANCLCGIIFFRCALA